MIEIQLSGQQKAPKWRVKVGCPMTGNGLKESLCLLRRTCEQPIYSVRHPNKDEAKKLLIERVTANKCPFGFQYRPEDMSSLVRVTNR